MSAVQAPPVTINLERDCGRSDECAPLADRLHEQLHRDYAHGASVLELPRWCDVNDWLATRRTADKRSARAARYGYAFRRIDRTEFVDDVFEINTSAARRQGRPMSPAYLERPTFSPLPEYPCRRHGLHTYGVHDNAGVLRAYAWIYRAGDLAMVSTILGHADYLERHVMYLLLAGVIERESREPGVLFYNLHDSGTDGLRWFKERFGLEARDVEWRP